MILNINCFVTQQPESSSLYSGRYACSCKVETEKLCTIYIHFMPQGITQHDTNDLRGKKWISSFGFSQVLLLSARKWFSAIRQMTIDVLSGGGEMCVTWNITFCVVSAFLRNEISIWYVNETKTGWLRFLSTGYKPIDWKPEIRSRNI